MNALVDAIHDHYKLEFGIPSSARGFELGELQLDVVVFDNIPCDGAQTIATAGLVSHVGQELLFSCYSHQFVPDSLQLIASVALQLFEAREGLRRGQVLGPAGPILPNARAEGFYACAPSYFPATLEPLVLADGGHVHFFWLVPILAQEAKWIAEQNDDELTFERMLEHQDPDLLDLNRSAIELG